VAKRDPRAFVQLFEEVRGTVDRKIDKIPDVATKAHVGRLFADRVRELIHEYNGTPSALVWLSGIINVRTAEVRTPRDKELSALAVRAKSDRRAFDSLMQTAEFRDLRRRLEKRFPTDFEDVYQEFATRLFRKIIFFDPARGRLTVWAGTIFKSARVDYLRRQDVAPQPCSLDAVEDVISPAPSPETLASGKRTIEKLRARAHASMKGPVLDAAEAFLQGKEPWYDASVNPQTRKSHKRRACERLIRYVRDLGITGLHDDAEPRAGATDLDRLRALARRTMVGPVLEAATALLDGREVVFGEVVDRPTAEWYERRAYQHLLKCASRLGIRERVHSLVRSSAA